MTISLALELLSLRDEVAHRRHRTRSAPLAILIGECLGAGTAYGGVMRTAADYERELLEIASLFASAWDVAEVGYWDHPNGFVLYHAINLDTGARYIGQSKKFVTRVREHYAACSRGVTTRLYDAMRKHRFTFVPIEEFSDQASVYQAEIDDIKLFRTMEPLLGYNVAPGGNWKPPPGFRRAATGKV